MGSRMVLIEVQYDFKEIYNLKPSVFFCKNLRCLKVCDGLKSRSRTISPEIWIIGY
jgi:hypothetical protein